MALASSRIVPQVRVTGVSLRNFRAFEYEAFAFQEQFTVLIGDNGAGKSALLDTAALRSGHFASKPHWADSEHTPRQTCAFNASAAARTIYAEQQYPVSIALEGEIEGLSFRNSLHHLSLAKGGMDEEDTSTPLINDLVRAVRAGEDRTIPVIAVYGTQRMRGGTKQRLLTRKPGSRLDGYTSAVTATTTAEAFTDWLRQRTGQGLEMGTPPDDLVAVLSAIEPALPDWNGIRFDFTEDTLLATRVREDHET